MNVSNVSYAPSQDGIPLVSIYVSIVSLNAVDRSTLLRYHASGSNAVVANRLIYKVVGAVVDSAVDWIDDSGVKMATRTGDSV